MGKVFNAAADCKPQLHYMVDISGRIEEIKRLVDRGEYFTINRARQYGKTTTLRALKRILDKEYLVVRSMLGFVKNDHGTLVIANRLFETRLYNLFLSEEEISGKIFAAGTTDKNQFIQNGKLNMDLVLKKFMMCWEELYSSADEKFIEDNGRKFFLLFLKPIINGIGNYYIESRTRDHGRTDVIVDYRGEQFVVEIKIWRGNEYKGDCIGREDDTGGCGLKMQRKRGNLLR